MKKLNTKQEKYAKKILMPIQLLALVYGLSFYFWFRFIDKGIGFTPARIITVIIFLVIIIALALSLVKMKHLE